MGLDLALSDDQCLLRDNIQRFLAGNDRPSASELFDVLGLGGVTVPEDAGGFGGGVVDMSLVVAELGPVLAGADWLSHAMAAWLLGQVAPGHAALSDLASGRRRAAVICHASTARMPDIDDGLPRGSAELVAGGAEADLFLFAGVDMIALIEADPAMIEQRHRIMHDGNVCADLVFTLKTGDVEPLASGTLARDLIEAANDMMLVARCAEAIGLMRRMMTDSADYLAQRKQFGRAIGTFQVLRHRAADMQIALMKAGALTEVAILAAAGKGGDPGRLTSAACVEVADAVRIVGEGAVQIHGAMGLTEELSLGGHFKRGLAIAAAFGPQAAHLARFAEEAA
ncbi:MAG: acyl-CoA dehydrogenase [Sphingomonadales bacterium]|nr:acyl-CoA dehydrogenase [Sphingomonadales bacterium]